MIDSDFGSQPTLTLNSRSLFSNVASKSQPNHQKVSKPICCVCSPTCPVNSESMSSQKTGFLIVVFYSVCAGTTHSSSSERDLKLSAGTLSTISTIPTGKQPIRFSNCTSTKSKKLKSHLLTSATSQQSSKCRHGMPSAT